RPIYRVGAAVVREQSQAHIVIPLDEAAKVTEPDPQIVGRLQDVAFRAQRAVDGARGSRHQLNQTQSAQGAACGRTEDAFHADQPEGELRIDSLGQSMLDDRQRQIVIDAIALRVDGSEWLRRWS